MGIRTTVMRRRLGVRLVFLALILTGCEGPLGPQGEPGPQGSEGPPGPAQSPLFAVVDNEHTGVVRENGVTAFDEGSPDNARVDITFDRTLTGCAWVVSTGDVGLSHPGVPASGARVEELVDDSTLRVVTFDTTGTATEYAFHLVVFC
jgi:hypothetical protein